MVSKILTVLDFCFSNSVWLSYVYGYASLTVLSLVHKESKCVGISRLSLIVFEIKAFNCFFYIFLTVLNNSVMTAWKLQGF